jgi:hypothetical protein
VQPVLLLQGDIDDLALPPPLLTHDLFALLFADDLAVYPALGFTGQVSLEEPDQTH